VLKEERFGELRKSRDLLEIRQFKEENNMRLSVTFPLIDVTVITMMLVCTVTIFKMFYQRTWEIFLCIMFSAYFPPKSVFSNRCYVDCC
jgi:hypothetical protein